MLPPNSLVLDGRFRVIRSIGSGGMGEVYLGEQVSLGRKVAIKVLHRDLRTEAGMLERFKREARMLSAVEHPAVVRIVDFGESGDAACLVMELVEGTSLFELLKSGPLPLPRALTVLHQLAEGLAAIHDKGIIHRDIKPENVFLTRTARGEQARLLDFGIARLIEPDPDSNVSQVGVVLGTPEYLSPEQAIGARVDARTDLYCLGVLAYRLLSGRLPFDGPSPSKYIAQHANVAPLPLDQAEPALAAVPALVALVMRLLEKDPANRFQNAQALADALAAVASGPLPEVPAPSVAPVPSEAPPPASGTAAFGAAAPVSSPASPPVPRSAEAPSPRQVPTPPTPLVSSGTAAFGVQAQERSAEQNPPPPSPPVISDTLVFSGSPPAPVAPPAASGPASFGRPALVPWDESADGDVATRRRTLPRALEWDPWGDSDTAGRRGTPSPSEPWDPPTGTSTTLFHGKTPGVARPLPPTTSGKAVFGAPRPSTGALPPSPTAGSPAIATPANKPPDVPWPTAADATPPVEDELGTAPTVKRPVSPEQPGLSALRQKVAALASPQVRRLAGLGLAGGLLLFGGVGLWMWNHSPEVQARRLLEEGKPAEALQRLDAVPAEDRKAPELNELRALTLHALKRHDDEHEVLLALGPSGLESVEERVLNGLAEDFGAEEGDKALRKLLDSLPKERLHDHFEVLAESEVSPRQWGALRYLEATQDTEGLDLVELYSMALASESCGVRGKAARRLRALGDPDAIPALQKLAEQPRDKQLPGGKDCGQAEAAAALRALEKPR